jgi:NAD(P)-dependent dehydrogenase (short-subunit alcohol dehydrogenase family)
LVVKLDVTNPAAAEAAVKATIDRFGRIDVLVNNAASFYAGYFEELSPKQMDLQLATSFVGPMNATRAATRSVSRATGQFWHGQKSSNGVAIWREGAVPRRWLG